MVSLDEGLHFVLIDPEIKDTYHNKPPMSLTAYGPGSLEFSDVTESYKEKDKTISDFLFHSAQTLIAYSPEKFVMIKLQENQPENVDYSYADFDDGYIYYVLYNKSENNFVQNSEWVLQNAKIMPVCKSEEEVQKLIGNSVEFTMEGVSVCVVSIRKGIFDPSSASLI